MNFYKILKVAIFLVTGILFACSPEKQQSVKKSNTIISTSETSQTTSTNSASHGLKVFIDPDTGKFLDAPPKKIVKPNEQINKQNNILVQDKKPVYEEKQSDKYNGGTYIKMPRP